MKVTFMYQFNNVEKPLKVNLYRVKHIKADSEELKIIERDDYHTATYNKSRITSIIDITEDE